MQINIIAFGFKYGVPENANFVFDVRFFPNPFYEEDLKNKTGNDESVQNYVMKDPTSKMFYEKIKDMVLNALELSLEKNKESLTFAIGCTGGRHRSVTFANKLYKDLQTKGYKISLFLRDVDKG